MKIKEKEMWEEFRKDGMLWMVNMNLHLFGYTLVMNKDIVTGEILSVYPSKVDFTGFSEKANEVGYERVKEYMKLFSEKA